MTQLHQFLINYFFIWYVHTWRIFRIFPEFFDLIISINQIFCKELSEVVSGQCIYFITLCIHVMDESSNLKAGCKKDVVHDAFDAIILY